ncbi:MAG: hypothetical protein AVDCRST_MAG68-3346 [uncultured Gemmatimonadetes bacterium]|uniref:ABC transporter, fused permease protein n=1 Tax=uncultured Gemmatimonadota bacterium TaxID=203437 RepID=A0A6J4LLX7_9BACT|nr:MAG: hypothetical protein AVDCRST_MAG68-3346 [uncultured Gemmatimonadota bacterium]
MKLPTSLLDFKLSMRMLAKYPFVSLVAALATSFAIAAGAIYFEVVSDLINPKLPLDDGGRVVEVRNEDLNAASREAHSLHDYVVWREKLRSVQDLGAFAVASRNVGPVGENAQPQEVVEISASAFRVARVAPLRGRGLTNADEAGGAPPVVVIGERLWEKRFGRDLGIVGKSLVVGATPHTVVGVMPKRFALPVNQQIWVPFRASALDHPRLQGPAIGTIGRLAPGATLEGAQAELKVIGERLAAEFPQTNERLRPRVLPYLDQFTPDTGESTVRLGVNVIFMMLLAVICANVGALVFARIVTREKEFAVRAALGASRGRIATQLFVEALLLTSIGAAVALAVVWWAVRTGESFLETTHGIAPPFWRDTALNPTTVLYAGVLAVVAAIVMGVLPALKFTRGSIEASLRRGSVGGSGMRSRRMSTVVIVVQVALAGALLPIAMTGALRLNWSEPAYPGIQPSEYLTVRYGIESPANTPAAATPAAGAPAAGAPAAGAQAAGAPAAAARGEAVRQAMKRRVLAEPGFAGLTFARQLPGSTHLRYPIEVSADGSNSSLGAHNVRVATVDEDFFTTFKTPILAGRGFRSSDVGADQGVVVVNQPFVRSVLGGRNAVGHRVRFTTPGGKEPGRWYEIVGVVPDLGMNPLRPNRSAGLYRLAGPSDALSGYMAIRVEGRAEDAAQKFRSMTGQVDDDFLIYDVRPLGKLVDSELQMDRAFALLVIGGSFFIVLLSAAVTFALMSFTVSQRKREIGIYKALGAGQRNILTSVFRRALLQLGLGAALGAAASIFVFSRAPGSSVDPVAMLAVVGVMLLVGLSSCGAPALRALRIEPTTAMRDDA